MTQPTQQDRMALAIDDIEQERLRQVEREGWSEDHDDQHRNGEIAKAAGCYLLFGESHPSTPPSTWPWGWKWWKPKTSRRSRLVRSGAMVLAEIERGDRLYGRGNW